MTKDEILTLMETVLQANTGSLTEAMRLEDCPNWDSLNMLNLQIELTANYPELDFDMLRECETVGDFLALCK